MNDFNALNLPNLLLKAIHDSGYHQPTPIQAQAIPAALAGQDLLLSAQTGSGKTAAFLLPILSQLINAEDKKSKQIKALILAPTRELAQQIQTQVRKYGRELKWLFSVALVGGADFRGQIQALRKGVQIVIATPGRLLDHLRSGRLALDSVQTLVLDEADRMLDMGFMDDLNAIVAALPEARQTIMSSATWAGMVGKIAQKYTKNPEKITIEQEVAHIEERAYFCDNLDHKTKILEHLLSADLSGQTLIFTATKMSSEDVCDRLRDSGHRARFIHGDLHQSKRNRIVDDLRKGKCDILVATDVVARGIDVPGIAQVINFDLPRQLEDYVHRIGRSGRAGRSGLALSLVSLEDRKVLAALGRYLGREMPSYEIPGLEPQAKPKAKSKPKKKFRGAPERDFGGKQRAKPAKGKRFIAGFDEPRRPRMPHFDNVPVFDDFDRPSRSERFSPESNRFARSLNERQEQSRFARQAEGDRPQRFRSDDEGRPPFRGPKRGTAPRPAGRFPRDSSGPAAKPKKSFFKGEGRGDRNVADW